MNSTSVVSATQASSEESSPNHVPNEPHPQNHSNFVCTLGCGSESVYSVDPHNTQTAGRLSVGVQSNIPNYDTYNIHTSPSDLTSNHFISVHNNPHHECNASDRFSIIEPVPQTHEFDEGVEGSSKLIPNETVEDEEFSEPSDTTQQTRKLIRQTFVPIGRPKGMPQLSWRPLGLQTKFILVNATVCFATAGGVFWLLFGMGSDRQAVLTSDNAHILSSYVPTALGTVIWLIFRSTVTDVLRMLAYIRMADQKGVISSGARPRLCVAATLFPFPLVKWRDQAALKAVVQVILLFAALLTSVKTVLLGSQRVPQGWILTIHEMPAYYLIAAYIITGSFYIAACFWLRNKSTGLRWDPAAPIDQLALAWNTDAFHQIQNLSLNFKPAYHILDDEIRWRIGYWIQSTTYEGGFRQEAIVYGIGMLNPKRASHRLDPSCTCAPARQCEFAKVVYPTNGAPGWLLIIGVVLVILLVLLITAAAAGALGTGFHIKAWWVLEENDIPQMFADVTGVQVKSSDSMIASIIFRVIPTILMQLYSVTFIGGLETRMRSTQNWLDLAAGPCVSTIALCSEYLTTISCAVPFSAVRNGHYRLATVSTIASAAVFCPILVSGLFIFERVKPDTLLVSCSKPAFYTVFAFLLLYFVVIVLAWPRETEVFLRPMHTIVDFIRPFANSELLMDDVLHEAISNAKTQPKFHAKVLLTEHYYQLGVDVGICGHDHLAVQIVGNENEGLHHNIVSVKALKQEKRRHGRGGWWAQAQYVDETAIAAQPAVDTEEDNTT